MVLDRKGEIVRREARAPSIPLCGRRKEIHVDPRTHALWGKCIFPRNEGMTLFRWDRVGGPDGQGLLPWTPAEEASFPGDLEPLSTRLFAADYGRERFRVSNSTGTIVVEYRPASGETPEALFVEARRGEEIRRRNLFVGKR